MTQKLIHDLIKLIVIPCVPTRRIIIIRPDKFAQATKDALADRVVIHHRWPNYRLVRSPAILEQFVRARVWIALESLSASLSEPVVDLVDVLVRPAKSVRAKQNMQLGALVIAPEASGLKVLEGDAAVAEAKKPASVEVYIDAPPAGFDGRVFLTGSAGGDYVAPYWFLEQTPSKDDANMSIMLYKVSMGVGSDPVACNIVQLQQPETMPSAIASSASDGPAAPAMSGEENMLLQTRQLRDGPGTDEGYFVFVPVYVNCMPVKKGDSLRFHGAATAAKSKALLPIAIDQLVKRARTPA